MTMLEEKSSKRHTATVWNIIITDGISFVNRFFLFIRENILYRAAAIQTGEILKSQGQIPVGAAPSRPKTTEREYPVARIPPVGKPITFPAGRCVAQRIEMIIAAGGSYTIKSEGGPPQRGAPRSES